MCGQDEEHPEAVADPCERVQEVYTPAINYSDYLINFMSGFQEYISLIVYDEQGKQMDLNDKLFLLLFDIQGKMCSRPKITLKVYLDVYSVMKKLRRVRDTVCPENI